MFRLLMFLALSLLIFVLLSFGCVVYEGFTGNPTFMSDFINRDRLLSPALNQDQDNFGKTGGFSRTIVIDMGCVAQPSEPGVTRLLCSDGN